MFRRKLKHPTSASIESTGDPTAAASAAVTVIDDDNFMDDTAGAITVVDFWAAWCGPCRTFAPIFAAAAGDYDGRVRFGKCDVDANPKTAGLLGILSIPTLIVFGPDGSELTRTSGAMPRRQLDALLEVHAATTRQP